MFENIFGSNEDQVVVAVATRHSGALQALEDAEEGLPLERREALSTQGLYDQLPGAHLAVVDLDELREFGITRARLEKALEQGDVVTVSGGAFIADPERFLNRARAASGLAGTLPARCVAFTSLAGGVGKTTLSLSLARTFRQETGLPTAVIELTYGPSGLLALTGQAGQDGSHLFEVITQGKEWPTWEATTLAPMDWDTTRLLESETSGRERLEEAWQALKDRHILTIFDAPSYHRYWHIAQELAESVFAVTDDRPDALASTASIAERDNHKIALTRGGMAGRIALEKSPAVRIPDVGDKARNFPPCIGRKVMSTVYPGWK